MSNSDRKLAAIVYTDIAGFSELSSNDENLAIDLINTQKEIVQNIVKLYSGIIHKELGDGFLLTFPTVTAAVEFGIDFQRAAKQIDGLRVRIGIHEGEITIQGDDVFGDDINIGARIEPHSPVGGIAISEKVKMELSSLPEYSTEFIGEPELKGIKQPVKIYCISSHGLHYPKTVSQVAGIVEKQTFNFNLLSLTGIILSAIGAAFWLWYTFSSVSFADSKNNKIFQSIAVLYLESHSSDLDVENLCTGLTSSITTAFSRLGVFDVKSRTDVLKFKNKVTTAEEIKSVLGVDAYIEGSLIKSPNNNEYIANITLVDAQLGNNLWAKEFKKTSENILNIPNTIVKEVTQFLNGDVVTETPDNSTVFEEGNNEIFSLLGEGINLLDAGKYQESVSVFDSILKREPSNLHSVFSKGQAFEGLGDYSSAISTYEELLQKDHHSMRTKQIWTHPDLTGKYKREIQVSDDMTDSVILDELSLWIVAIKNATTNSNSTEISVIDLFTNKIVWTKSFSLQNLKFVAVGKYLVVMGSSLSSDENATVYIYDLQSSNLLMSKEFRKDFENQRMVLSVMKDRAANVPEYKNLIFLNIRRDDYYNIILLDPKNNGEKWRKTIPLQAVQEGSPTIHVIESDNKHYIFHQKGINLYLYSAEGERVWARTLSDDSDHVSIYKDRLISYSNSSAIITIQNIISQKNIGRFELSSNPDGKAGIFNGNFIVNTKNSVTSLKTEKPFLRSLENWTVTVDAHDRIGRGEIIFSVSDNIFLFTKSGNLYCINNDSGQIININKLDADSKPVFKMDNTSKSFILYSNGFLIGLDPHNGKTLWKIRELNVSWPWSRITLFENQVIVMKRKNNQIIINTYARSTGELLWTTNEKLWPNDSLSHEREYHWGTRRIKKNRNTVALYIKTNTNGLYSTDLTWSPNKNYIPKTDIYNRLADCYNKTNNYKDAERLLIDVVDLIDQQNERAFTQLSDLYLSNGNIIDFIDIQAKFHELILYDDIKRGVVEGRLMKHANLQWVHSFQETHEFAIQPHGENMLIAGNCGALDEDEGCTISSFRKNTGIKLWEEDYNFSECKIVTSSKNNFSFVGMKYSPGFEDSSKATLFAVDVHSGKTVLETILWEWKGRVVFYPRKIYYWGSTYIVDSDVLDRRHIVAINSETGLIRWEKELDKDTFLRGKPIDIVRSDGSIIVAHDEELISYELISGKMQWSYDYTDNIFGIDYLSQSGVNSGKISFLSEDKEFIVLNTKNTNIYFQESVDFDQAARIIYLDENYVLGYNIGGYISLFEKNASGITNVWKVDVGEIRSLMFIKKKIHVFNDENYFSVNFNNGAVSSEVPLIWKPESVFIDNKHLGCFTGKNLYLINL